MRSEVFRVDNYPAAAAVATGKALMAADSGSLSSVTGTDKREERGENQISGLLSLSVRLRLGTLAKRRDRTRAQLRKDGIGL